MSSKGGVSPRKESSSPQVAPSALAAAAAKSLNSGRLNHTSPAAKPAPPPTTSTPGKSLFSFPSV